MCRACWETPDSQGRRCPRDDGFSGVESDQRNRARGLNNAAGALANGDIQAATNQLENARRAQRSLDGVPVAPAGEPTETTGPSRDIMVSPSSVDTARVQLNQINQQRTHDGLQPLTVDITRQATPDGDDPIMAWEHVTIRISGATQDELDQLRLQSITADPERRVSTGAVLAATCAITRMDSDGRYVSRKEGGADSTPSRVVQYVNDDPDGAMRRRYEPNQNDLAKANGVRRWARENRPTNDYVRAMRHALAEEHLGHREVGVAASAIAGYNRDAEELAEHNRAVQEQALADHAAGKRPGGEGPGLGASGRRALTGSRWLNQPGDKIMVTGTVEKVVQVFHEKRWDPRHLYLIRTPDGDVVKWLPPDFTGFKAGDEVTLRGQVKAHIRFNGEKQTEMFYCKPELHNSPAR